MRRLTTYLAGWLGAGLVLLSALPAAAQGGPPTANPTPDFRVVALPFSDTFSVMFGWQAIGGWDFGDDLGYSGGGWAMDGAYRSMVHTLTYQDAIDLHGTLSAQLIWREKGTLPNTDLVAVDISLDGGETWIMLDPRIGLDVPKWDARMVDLTYYRGQVIRLRFRVITGPESSTSPSKGSGYSLDNVTIQYIAAPEDVITVPLDPTPRTLLGLHLTMGAQGAPVIDLVRSLKEIGWPLGTLKGVSGTESILNAVKQESPNTVIIFRSLQTPWGVIDCPSGGGDPVQAAQDWVAGLQPYWTPVNADYYELTNECHPPAGWLIPFSIEAMRQASARGQCLLLFSFAAGNPEPEEFKALRPVFEYALNNPCPSGRLNGIALHTYGVQPHTLVSESGLALGLRHRLFMAQILPDLPEAIRIPVYITEAGAGDGRTKFQCADIARDVLQYTQQLEFDPYVRSFDLWTLGRPDGEWFDVTPCLPLIRDAVLSYYRGKPPPGP